jgi:predicted nucleic acid-binding protein
MGLLMEGIRRVYIDANIFIAAFEAEGNVADQAARLLSDVAVAVPQKLVTSELTLAELLVLPLRKSDFTLIDLYSGLLIPHSRLDVRPATRETFIKAAEVRAQTPSRKLPDAVHIATAILSGCTHILSADKGIGGQGIVGSPLAILRPDEETLTHLLESLAR